MNVTAYSYSEGQWYSDTWSLSATDITTISPGFLQCNTITCMVYAACMISKLFVIVLLIKKGLKRGQA